MELKSPQTREVLSPPFEPPSYTISTADDGTLQWDPPLGSQELALTLSYHFPLQRTLAEKMQVAIGAWLKQQKKAKFQSVDGGKVDVKSGGDGTHQRDSKSSETMKSYEKSTATASIGAIGKAFTPVQSLPAHKRANERAKTQGRKAALTAATRLDVPGMTSWRLQGGAFAPGRRKKRVYTDEERMEVGRNRGMVCEFHRLKKLKCDPKTCPHNKLRSEGKAKNQELEPRLSEPASATTGERGDKLGQAFYPISGTNFGIESRSAITPGTDDSTSATISTPNFSSQSPPSHSTSHTNSQSMKNTPSPPQHVEPTSQDGQSPETVDSSSSLLTANSMLSDPQNVWSPTGFSPMLSKRQFSQFDDSVPDSYPQSLRDGDVDMEMPETINTVALPLFGDQWVDHFTDEENFRFPAHENLNSSLSERGFGGGDSWMDEYAHAPGLQDAEFIDLGVDLDLGDLTKPFNMEGGHSEDDHGSKYSLYQDDLLGFPPSSAISLGLVSHRSAVPDMHLEPSQTFPPRVKMEDQPDWTSGNDSSLLFNQSSRRTSSGWFDSGGAPPNLLCDESLDSTKYYQSPVVSPPDREIHRHSLNVMNIPFPLSQPQSGAAPSHGLSPAHAPSISPQLELRQSPPVVLSASVQQQSVTSQSAQAYFQPPDSKQAVEQAKTKSTRNSSSLSSFWGKWKSKNTSGAEHSPRSSSVQRPQSEITTAIGPRAEAERETGSYTVNEDSRKQQTMFVESNDDSDPYDVTDNEFEELNDGLKSKGGEAQQTYLRNNVLGKAVALQAAQDGKDESLHRYYSFGGATGKRHDIHDIASPIVNWPISAVPLREEDPREIDYKEKVRARFRISKRSESTPLASNMPPMSSSTALDHPLLENMGVLPESKSGIPPEGDCPEASSYDQRTAGLSATDEFGAERNRLSAGPGLKSFRQRVHEGRRSKKESRSVTHVDPNPVIHTDTRADPQSAGSYVFPSQTRNSRRASDFSEFAEGPTTHSQAQADIPKTLVEVESRIAAPKPSVRARKENSSSAARLNAAGPMHTIKKPSNSSSAAEDHSPSVIQMQLLATVHSDYVENTTYAERHQAAKETLLYKVAEASRVRNEPEAKDGVEGTGALMSGIGAGGIDAAAYRDHDHHSKRHVLEAVIGGLAGNRLVNSSSMDAVDDGCSIRERRSRSRSRSRGMSRSRSISRANRDRRRFRSRSEVEHSEERRYRLDTSTIDYTRWELDAPGIGKSAYTGRNESELLEYGDDRLPRSSNSRKATSPEHVTLRCVGGNRETLRYAHAATTVVSRSKDGKYDESQVEALHKDTSTPIVPVEVAQDIQKKHIVAFDTEDYVKEEGDYDTPLLAVGSWGNVKEEVDELNNLLMEFAPFD